MALQWVSFFFSIFVETIKKREMIIVNSKVLNENVSKDSELYNYAKEYQEGVQALKTRFPDGVIRLKRNGFPKQNRLPDGALGLPEIPTPIYIKLTKTDKNGVSWGYCQGQPLIHPNGLVEVPPNNNSASFDSEVESFDLKQRPDYVFYIIYKSGLVGVNYSIWNPEGDRITVLQEKNATLKVQASIREMEEEKLRMVSQAWGVKDAGKKNLLILQDEIENLVFSMEAKKKEEPTNLMLKGVNEFLAEIKADEITRPKAIIQLALDEKRLTFNPANSHMYFDAADICYIPPDKVATRLDFLAQVLRQADRKEQWQGIIKALLDEAYINKLDKYGVRWVAGQLDIPLNKKEESLREALLGEFASK